MKLRSLFVLGLASLAAYVTSAAAAVAERVFDVSGVVRAPLKDGRLVVSHDDIAGFMPAMTMRFTVANPAEAARLTVGDRVGFHLRVTETDTTASDFKVLSRATTVSDESSAPATTKSSSVRLREGDTVPHFALVDQNARAFTEANFKNNLTVVTFIFTRCPVPEYCPAMAARFGQLQKRILADPGLTSCARLLSVSIDPEFDRPEILHAYGEAVGAKPAVWAFATGEKSEVTSLTKEFAVFTERNGVTLDHTLCTALIDQEGRVVELWRGNGWTVDEIVAALTRLAAR